MNRRTAKTQHLKKALLETLEKCLGNVSEACNKLKINRSTFYDYCKVDADFKVKAESIGEVALDFVEGQLFKNIRRGDTTAIIFYLKTKGKQRGYIERQELNIGDARIIVTRK